DPEQAEAYQVRGCAYLGKKALDQAVADLTESLRRNPEDAGCYNERGRAYFLAEDYERAVADFTAAIKLDGKVADYYLNRSRACEKKGDRETARSARERAAALSSDPAPGSSTESPTVIMATTQAASGCAPPLRFEGHKHWVNSIAISRDGQHVLSGSSD